MAALPNRGGELALPNRVPQKVLTVNPPAGGYDSKDFLWLPAARLAPCFLLVARPFPLPVLVTHTVKLQHRLK